MHGLKNLSAFSRTRKQMRDLANRASHTLTKEFLSKIPWSQIENMLEIELAMQGSPFHTWHDSIASLHTFVTLQFLNVSPIFIELYAALLLRCVFVSYMDDRWKLNSDIVETPVMLETSMEVHDNTDDPMMPDGEFDKFVDGRATGYSNTVCAQEEYREGTACSTKSQNKFKSRAQRYLTWWVCRFCISL